MLGITAIIESIHVAGLNQKPDFIEDFIYSSLRQQSIPGSKDLAGIRWAFLESQLAIF
jgi:hypothetical protein